MTRFLKWLNNPYVLGVLVVIGAATDLILIGREVDLSKSDWGTWVGSVGTVATLVGTIWLATAQTRQKNRDDLTLARLHAASMVLRLHHAESMVSSVCQTLSTALDTPIELSVEHLNDMGLKLSSIKPWGISDLVPLIPLPKNTAAKLAQAADNLDSMGMELSRATANYQELNSDERQNFAKYLYVMLFSALEYIEEAGRICSREAGALEQQGH
jgi:hypothetical protein